MTPKKSEIGTTALTDEMRYSLLYATMPVGMVFGEVEYDEAGHAVDCLLLDVNSAAGSMLEMAVTDLVGKRLSQLHLIKREPLQVVSKVVSSGQAHDYELALPHLGKIFNLSICRPERGRFAAVINDITASKKAQQEIERLAYYDTLTGLPNRVLILDRLELALAQADRAGSLVGVLAMDLDHFKKINDSLGVGYGDQLLKIIADRLRQNLRQGDSVARMGGDEFVVIFQGAQHKKDIVTAANKVLDLLSEPLTIDGHQLVCTASVGIAVYPIDADEAKLLLKNADTAMYQAKEAGRNLYQFYAPEMNTRAFERLFLGADLLRAIERQELEVYYQPQLAVATGKVVGVEALLRWNHPQRGQISPALFIPLAEESDLIFALGRWVMYQACQQARIWLDEGYTPIRVAVNLSARQFLNDLPAIVLEVLEQTKLPHHLLELELTEGLLMDKPEMARSILNQLRQIGVQLAIDDFGTGYSSLSYLKHFPLNRLKIDRSFVKDLGKGEDDATIIEAIIALAHGLHLEVIAEGVETPTQMDFLVAQGCDMVQGFLYARNHKII